MNTRCYSIIKVHDYIVNKYNYCYLTEYNTLCNIIYNKLYDYLKYSYKTVNKKYSLFIYEMRELFIKEIFNDFFNLYIDAINNIYKMEINFLNIKEINFYKINGMTIIWNWNDILFSKNKLYDYNVLINRIFSFENSSLLTLSLLELCDIIDIHFEDNQNLILMDYKCDARKFINKSKKEKDNDRSLNELIIEHNYYINFNNNSDYYKINNWSKYIDHKLEIIDKGILYDM